MTAHHAIAFLPWVRIDQPIDAGRLRFVPYVRGERPGIDVAVPQDALDRVLAAYVNPPRYPVAECTLVEFDNWRVGDDIPEPSQIWLARVCIGMAGLSSRRLFRQHFDYCNYDTYQLAIQRFTIESAGTFSFTARRRDGVVSHLWDAEGFVWRRPSHVPPHFRMSVEQAQYASTLLAACARDASLAEALEEFVLANTDSTDVPVHVEVVMVKSAFEWLYSINENVEEFVRALMADVRDVLEDVDEIPEGVRNHWNGVSPKATRPLTAWAREFCNLRGAAAHGKDVRHSRFRWSPEAHLAFASYLFPMLVGHKLRRSDELPYDAYDQARIRFIERLLAPEILARGKGSDHPWSEFERRCHSARTKEYIESALHRVSASDGESAPEGVDTEALPDQKLDPQASSDLRKR